MCRPLPCKTCNKITWAGCGQHVAQVKSGVPRENWCEGRSAHPEVPASGFFARLLGR